VYGIRNKKTDRLLTIGADTYTVGEEYWGQWSTSTYVMYELHDVGYGMPFLWPYKDEVAELIQKGEVKYAFPKRIRIYEYQRVKEDLVLFETKLNTGFNLV
jgi:hypothetical protein